MYDTREPIVEKSIQGEKIDRLGSKYHFSFKNDSDRKKLDLTHRTNRTLWFQYLENKPDYNPVGDEARSKGPLVS